MRNYTTLRATVVVAISGLALMMTGCATHSQSGGTARVPALTPAGVSADAVTDRPVAATAGVQAASPTPRSSQQSPNQPRPAVVPVSHLSGNHAGDDPAGVAEATISDGYLAADCGHAACGPRGCQLLRRLADGPAAGCPSGCCPPQPCPPQQYALPCPPDWNLYGIDPQEFLCDGGDRDPEAMLRRDDSIAGLGLEDTVVHYTTASGNIEFRPSNRVCVYAPRFTAVRKITGAVAGGRAVGLGGLDAPLGPIRVQRDLPGLAITETTELQFAEVARRIDAMRDRNRGVPVEAILQPELAADVMAALAAIDVLDPNVMKEAELALIERLALAAVAWTVDESLEVAIADLRPPTLTRDERVEAMTLYEFPDGRLRIIKLADRADALPGEVVTFMIRVENVGDSAVTDVVLSDNLTTRLEYVPDSQSVEGVEAEFSAVENEGQSSKLTWKFTEPLEVGDCVTIRFDCKVR